MTKKEIKFRDPVVERVVDKFVSRSDVGFKKYGTTLHEERTQKIKGLIKYLNDIQESHSNTIKQNKIYDMLGRELKEIPRNKLYIKNNKIYLND